MTYIIVYLAFVILTPMLILAAGILAVWQRVINGAAKTKIDPAV